MGGCMRKTNRSIKLKCNEVSIESLPIECLLMIFKWLKIDDLMNVAKTCRLFEDVAKQIFNQNLSVTINRQMVEKGEKYVDRLFYYMRECVKSLDIDCSCGKLNWNKIINSCTNLKTLKIHNWIGEGIHNVSSSFQIDNVKHLTLNRCDCDFTQSVLERMHKVNDLAVIYCSITLSCEALATLLQKYPDIKSFNFCDEETSFELGIVNLQLEEFRLTKGKFENILELFPLNRLSKLEVYCNGTNLNHLLKQLGRIGILKELNLYSVEVDDLFFETLKSLDMLQVLILSPSINSIIISPIWSSNLKQLQIFQFPWEDGSNFYFTLSYKAFISTIQQLHYLETFNLTGCDIVESDKVFFKDLEKLSQRIFNVMNYEVRKKRLCVVLPGHLGRGYSRETFEGDELTIIKDEDYSQCKLL